MSILNFIKTLRSGVQNILENVTPAPTNVYIIDPNTLQTLPEGLDLSGYGEPKPAANRS